MPTPRHERKITTMEKLAQLYKQWKGAEPVTVEALPEAGSNRRYFRLTDGTGISVIGVIGTSRDENHTFVYLTRHFTDRRLPVPHILAVSDDELDTSKPTSDIPPSLKPCVADESREDGTINTKNNSSQPSSASCPISKCAEPADSTGPYAIHKPSST